MKSKWLKMLIVALSVAVLSVGSVWAVSGNVMETWSTATLNGWQAPTQDAVVSVKADTQALTVGFGSTDQATPLLGTALATMDASQAAFVGNYLDKQIKGIAFKVSTGGVVPDRLAVRITSATGEWLYRVDSASLAQTGWITVVIPFAVDQWLCLAGADKQAGFDALLSAVDSVQIEVMRHSNFSQTYMVDDVMLLQGQSVEFGQALYAYLEGNGLSNANIDSDGDGLINLDEFKAGTSATDANSNNKIVSIVVDENGDATLTWNAVAGMTYDVKRAGSVAGPYESVGDAVTADKAVATFLDKGAPQPSFYRVVSR